MLQVVSYSGESFAQCSARPLYGPAVSWETGTPFASGLLVSDPLLYALFVGNTGFNAGYLPMADWIHYSTSGGVTVRDVQGLAPRQDPYSSLVDATRYGSLSTNLSAFVRVLSGQNVFNFDPSGEHNVRHENLRGVLLPKSLVNEDRHLDLSLAPNTYQSRRIDSTWGSLPVPVYSSLGSVFHGYRPTVSLSVDGAGRPVSLPVDDSSGHQTDIAELADFLLSTWLPAVGGSVWRTRAFDVVQVYYKDVAIERSYRGVHIEYTQVMYITYLGVTSHDENRFEIDYSLASDLCDRRASEGSYPVHLNDAVLVTVSALESSSRGWFSTPSQMGVAKQSFMLGTSPALLTPFHTIVGGPENVDVEQCLYRALNQHAEITSLVLHDVRPSSFFSTSDAMDELAGAVDQNMIENIVELGDLASSLPNLASIARVVRGAASGRIVRTLRDALDVLTELRLQDRFSWTPTLQLAEDGLEQFASAYRELERRLDNPTVAARGAFHWVFPDGVFPDRTTLETRSKVVAASGLSPGLAKFLGIRTLGFAPTLAQYWDLIPFSFVVDWFLNVGGRARAVESLALLVAIGPSCIVQSYRIVSSLDDTGLDRIGLGYFTSAGDDSIQLVSYIREVSQHLPPIRSGRYDFGSPLHWPNWLTAGSLLFQLTSS